VRAARYGWICPFAAGSSRYHSSSTPIAAGAFESVMLGRLHRVMRDEDVAHEQINTNLLIMQVCMRVKSQDSFEHVV
jgi:hypothetical protein